MEAKGIRPIGASADEWQQMWSRWLVVRAWPKLKDPAHAGWLYLWWECGGRHGNLVSVVPSELAKALGRADSATGRRVLRALKESGLIEDHTGPHACGRWSVCCTEPLDVCIARRHGSDGQGELLSEADEPHEAIATDPESPPTVRIAGDTDPADAETHQPGGRPPADARAHPPDGRARRDGGGAVDLEDFEDFERSARDDLDFERTSGAPRDPLTRKDPSRPGGSAGASAETAAALVDTDRRRQNERSVAMIVREIADKVPYVWDEIAIYVARQVLGLNPLGAGRQFDDDELQRIINRTRGLAGRGELTRPAPVYFAGACRIRFRELGLAWPDFKPSKPKPR